MCSTSVSRSRLRPPEASELSNYKGVTLWMLGYAEAYGSGLPTADLVGGLV
ncbi:hypothetical protein MB901379_01814 [Mycobacterium basiliense]|uniref:Uncharacterized protein n=1 Tax=Mycobacterium basiliense TaxID=2094119 RepID=A0A447GCN1_9MYCO|nr:hypothetical protein MB901379_01814 [Mycobacterium basiliense]